jgi:NADH-quinone oxidoreductase subunit G
MPLIEIDGQQLEVAPGATVMDAAHQAGIVIPHFCYHKKLSIAASCRMCLVEVEKAPKPLPACATPVTDGMKVKTHSPKAIEAQKGVMEFLLINHPLDCPICDQGGECMLQDVAVGYGGSASRYDEAERVVKDKDLGPFIATDMTRCIHCSRCVRFGQEVAGLMELGMAHRGEHTEVMPFLEAQVTHELSGNVIELCPVGALTSKPFRYSARSWELSRRKSVSPHDGLGANVQVHVKNGRVFRVAPQDNEAVN